jgi:hypothetical protein
VAEEGKARPLQKLFSEQRHAGKRTRFLPGLFPAPQILWSADPLETGRGRVGAGIAPEPLGREERSKALLLKVELAETVLEADGPSKLFADVRKLGQDRFLEAGREYCQVRIVRRRSILDDEGIGAVVEA